MRRLLPTAARWYSDAPQNPSSGENKEGTAETSPEHRNEEAGEPAEDSVVAEVKKKLETKEKEAADWKVGRVVE